MPRAMGMFPYYQDDVPGPNTDGTLSAVPTGRDTNIANPQSAPGVPAKNSGTVIKGTIGDTDVIFATKISYGVFAGDS